MIGAIFGDIVGSPYEFVNTKNYNFVLLTEQSQPTDDTYMTLAVCKALMESKRGTDDEIKSALVKELRYIGQKYPNKGYGAGFKGWLNSKSPQPYNSCGNGSAMRVSSVGWLSNSLEEALRLAELSAVVTHNHPEGIKGAKAVAAAIFLARAGATKEQIRSYIVNSFDYNLFIDWSTLKRTYKWNGTCQGSVPQAIMAFLVSESYEDCIRQAVSLGGDSDTIACIAGSIAEAYYKSEALAYISEVTKRLDVEMKMILYDFVHEVSYPVGRAVKSDWDKEITPVSILKRIKYAIDW